MSMSRKFMFDSSVNTRNPKSSGLFGMDINIKLENRVKECLLVTFRRYKHKTLEKQNVMGNLTIKN